MDDKELVEVARVLSSDHGLRILRSFSDDEWRIASEVSSHLDIHTSTASKYLAQLYTSGLLERRVRKTGRRSTYEYHLNEPTILLQLNLAEGHELKTLECWDACLEVYHRLISAGSRYGFKDLEDEIDKLIGKLGEGTGAKNLCLFDPKCDLSVAKRLVRMKLEERQLNEGLSCVRETSQLIFDAVRTLCLERMGSIATEKLFGSVLSEIEREDGKVIRALGLAGTFERGFTNG